MMIKKDNNKSDQPKKSGLLVTVYIDPKTQPFGNHIMGSIIEFEGIWLELKKSGKKHAYSALFENIKNGEKYYEMFSYTDLKVTKEEI